MNAILPKAEGTRQREYFPQDFVRGGAGGLLALAGMTLTPGGAGLSGILPFSPRFSGTAAEVLGKYAPNAKQYGRAGNLLAQTAFTTNLSDNVEYQKRKNETLEKLLMKYGVNK